MDFFNFLKEKSLIIISISVIVNILFIGGIGYLIYDKVNFTCPKSEELALTTEVTTTDEEKKEPEKFYVEIKGAVANPGVYLANNDNIINDIVNLAGGFTKTAYTNNINLSRKVSNELVVYVYTKTEYKKIKELTKVDEVCESSTYDITNCITNNQSEIISSDKDTTFENSSSSGSNTESSSSKLVNINTASKEELMSISGVGEAKAENIIQYRNTNGNFKSIEDIKNVSGIGDAMFEKIKDSITV